MADSKWEKVTVATGELQAEIIRGMLEAKDIEVLLFQEGAGKVFSVSVGPLAEVEILVPADKKDEATRIIDEYYAQDEGAEQG
ncbi:MAG: DUF2007 domain-containing protein [Anaerolineales bacterium]|nr:DUF2007 domain-containing protein [Anaerolineales bacterium]